MSSSNPNPSSLPTDAPWNTPWPASELESVPACPVCGSAERKILHEDLIDNVFYCAPGKWTSWRCLGCSGSYLDPRPSRASIHLAYDIYYTHGEAKFKSSYAALSPLRKFRRRLVNGYTNWRFSTNELPSSRIGIILWALWPLRLRLEYEYRHLPQQVPEGGRVLDVGCASGAFLVTARACGWVVTGVEPDPKSIANAQSLDLDVHQGGLEVFDGKSNVFDVITICHVIEHVHEPLETLVDMYRLLKPGGQLWLETPNIESVGHNYFGRNWRGLEPPRHLAVFSPRSLRMALERAGFSGIQYKPAPSPLRGIVAVSEALRQGLPCGSSVKQSVGSRAFVSVVSLIQVIWPAKRESVWPAKRESMLIVAHKDKGRSEGLL